MQVNILDKRTSIRLEVFGYGVIRIPIHQWKSPKGQNQLNKGEERANSYSLQAFPQGQNFLEIVLNNKRNKLCWYYNSQNTFISTNDCKSK